MDKYNHKLIESKWQKYWDENNTFITHDDYSKKKHYVLGMFPYPSSAGLHVGHPEGYTANDIVARYRRTRYQENILHPMGFDAFGLPAENYAIKVGKNPKEITADSIKTFTRQLKSLGFSYDWSRQVITCQPEYYRWTQWMFCQLYKKGLAYKKKAPVNWCESCKTVLAREQVIDGKCERCKNQVIQKELEQWFFKVTGYAEELLSDLEKLDWPESIKTLQRNWIGRSEGAMIKFPISRIQNTNKSQNSNSHRQGGILLRRDKSQKNSKNRISKIFIGTQNLAKKKRYVEIFKSLGIEVVSFDDLKDIKKIDIKEGEDIEYNALLKARRYAEITGLPTLATDEAFFIDRFSQDKQPCAKVRRIPGAENCRPTDQEVLHYYIQEVEKVGGESLVHWEHGVAFVDENQERIARFVSQSDKKIVSKASNVMKDGYPLDSIQIELKTGKYRSELSDEEEKASISEYEKWLVNFLGEVINRETFFLEVFTTRPDTIFGATYMVVAPEHELISHFPFPISNFDEVERYIEQAKKKNELERTDLAKEKTGVELQGIKAINPASGEEIPIFVADYVLMGYGTGVIMAVPAHDERDWEFAKKYNLPIKKVVQEDTRHKIQDTNKSQISNSNPEITPDVEHSIFKKDCFAGDGITINSGEFNGLSTEEFKQKVTEWLEKKGLGKRAINYKLRDWLISRQRYWGAPIPVIYCHKCLETQNSKLKTKNFSLINIGKIDYAIHLVPESDLPVLLPDDVDFRPTGESPLARSLEFNKNFKCPICGATEGVRREVDTMDTFVCSSWYFLRYTDPHNEVRPFDEEKVKYWLPVNLYVGGAEHAVLHLMYARFFTKALADMGYLDFREPFLKLRNQGMILAEDGRKMSKSLGNVINPDEVVNQYGADTLRLYEMFMGPLEDTKPWSTKSIVGIRRFLERVWKLQGKIQNTRNKIQINSKFQILTAKAGSCCGGTNSKNLALERLVHKTIKKVTEDIEEMKFNTAISQLMILVNSLEKEKQILMTDYQLLIILLSPFAPHIAEELWEKLGHDDSISAGAGKAVWPKYDRDLIKDETINLVVQINGKLRATISVPADIAEAEAKAAGMKNEKIKKWLKGKEVIKMIFVPGRLVNIVVK